VSAHAEEVHGHGDGHGHNPYLAHHFENMEQQFDSGKMGMWLFLATELLLFAGLFAMYAVNRSIYPELFMEGHHYLDRSMGAINTVILLFSSLTMAWAVRAAQLGQQKLLVKLLVVTFLCGCGFLVVKTFEYGHKIHDGLLPGKYFNPKHLHETAAASSPTAKSTTTAPVLPGAEAALIPVGERGPEGLAARTKAEPLSPERKIGLARFFSMYFVITGLHAFHVIIGMSVIAWLIVKAMKGTFGPSYFTPVDLGGLYWHLVDLIWIYLFPLLYLIH
jgi:cytochrome c oxidase subunit 3